MFEPIVPSDHDPAALSVFAHIVSVKPLLRIGRMDDLVSDVDAFELELLRWAWRLRGWRRDRCGRWT